MNEKLVFLKERLKNPKILITIGIIGMVLIALSSFITDGNESKATDGQTVIDIEEYKEELEEAVADIVKSVTGDKKATVVITLENTVKYSYADSSETDSSNSSGEKSEQSSEKKSQSYVTVRTSDGGEEALLVTEFMPQVRGVAIICKGGDNEILAEKIKNAVKAALQITSQRVYITGGK